MGGSADTSGQDDSFSLVSLEPAETCQRLNFTKYPCSV